MLATTTKKYITKTSGHPEAFPQVYWVEFRGVVAFSTYSFWSSYLHTALNIYIKFNNRNATAPRWGVIIYVLTKILHTTYAPPSGGLQEELAPNFSVVAYTNIQLYIV